MSGGAGGSNVAAAKFFSFKFQALTKKSQDIVHFFVDNHNRLCYIAALLFFLTFNPEETKKCSKSEKETTLWRIST